MALVSTQVSCRKAFVQVDSAASKDNSLKEVGIFSVNLNSEALSSWGLETRSKEPSLQPLTKGDCAIQLVMLNGPKAFGGVIWTRTMLIHKPHNTIKTQKTFFHLKKLFRTHKTRQYLFFFLVFWYGICWWLLHGCAVAFRASVAITGPFLCQTVHPFLPTLLASMFQYVHIPHLWHTEWCWKIAILPQFTKPKDCDYIHKSKWGAENLEFHTQPIHHSPI